MKKQVYRYLLIVVCISSNILILPAQDKLKVDGDVRIDGVLKLIDGNDNIIIGDSTGLNNVGSASTFIGTGAGRNNSIGSSNTFLGKHAGYHNVDRSNLVAIGDSALFNNGFGVEFSPLIYAKYNTAIGSKALYSNTKGAFNTAIGFKAMYSNDMGVANTAIGYQTMFSNSSGGNNTIVGYQSLFSNTSGSFNTSTGYHALNGNTTGSSNTAIGHSALSINSSGSSNTAIGSSAMIFNILGQDNTAIGGSALRQNNTGSSNTATGVSALSFNTMGNFNSAFGVISDVSLQSLDHATAIGANSISNANDKTVIGRNGLGIVIGGYANWSNLSDGRFKESVKENVPGLEFISRLRPVTYWVNLEKLQYHITAEMPDTIAIQYLPSKEDMMKAIQEIHTGFVAQEVEAVAQEIGYRFDGVNVPKNPTDNYSIAYGQFVPSIVKATQEQQELIKKLEAENTEQNRKLTAMLQENQELRGELAEIRKMLSQVLDGKGPSEVGQTIQLEGAHLLQNVPNPFAEATFIEYFLPDNIDEAQIQVTDMAGRVLKLETVQQTGYGRLKLQAQALPAGSYAYSLIVDGKLVATKQMVVTSK